jgi:head-tail adaptor
MRAGRLRQIVEVHTATEEITPAGDRTYTYAPRHSDVPANIEWLTADEQETDPNIRAIRRAKVTMRWMDGIKALDRLVFEGRVLEIDGPPIDVENRNHVLEMQCVERVDE